MIPAERSTPEPCTHEGYEWLYVLSGQLRLVLADHDVILTVGEAAEFDTRQPHWFGSTGHEPVEILSLFGRQGERIPPAHPTPLTPPYPHPRPAISATPRGWQPGASIFCMVLMALAVIGGLLVTATRRQVPEST